MKIIIICSTTDYTALLDLISPHELLGRLKFVGGHFMPLLDSNGGAITGNSRESEVGQEIQQKSSVGGKTGKLWFMVGTESRSFNNTSLRLYL